ncbi:carboxypeptidase regulatory-like domain-containing protein [Parapedobacter deserti]|uniref:Carboxypeptidase regulatory-like domain-containing protein n=1 Tax=Parapedobacter deserti TaxID=1912957 RepID=A0ABV7JG34_9SPHI
MSKFCLQPILLFFPFTGLGQTLKGTVRDMETQEPLQYATISVIGQNRRVVTASDGTFTADISREKASDSITVSYIGYRTATFAIRDKLAVCSCIFLF